MTILEFDGTDTRTCLYKKLDCYYYGDRSEAAVSGRKRGQLEKCIATITPSIVRKGGASALTANTKAASSNIRRKSALHAG